MGILRRDILRLSACLATLPVASRRAFADTYPSRPVRVLVATSAGGSTDIIGRLVARENPQKVTQERAVQKRAPGTVLIDASQNAEGRPLAAVYTVRAFPYAPVSTPIEHAELKRSLRPEKLNLKTTPARVEKLGDLWSDFWKKRQRLEEALERLHQLTLDS